MLIDVPDYCQTQRSQTYKLDSEAPCRNTWGSLASMGNVTLGLSKTPYTMSLVSCPADVLFVHSASHSETRPSFVYLVHVFLLTCEYSTLLV